MSQLASQADDGHNKLPTYLPACLTLSLAALSLLSDPALRRLVDEFFFELHFQCEVWIC